MRQTRSDLDQTDFELPGLKRRKLVEFQTHDWTTARRLVDQLSDCCSVVVSLNISAIENSYRVKAVLEEIHDSRLHGVLSDRSLFHSLCTETLFYRESERD